ncbi:alkaline phosphatase family protein [Rhodococcus koreensis]
MRRNRSRLRRRGGADAAPGEPGLLCIQIDGLGHAVLQRAIRDGVTPHLAGLVHRGSHVLTSWHTDWSSQTGASQLAILHGDNHNVPAFRWYDKTRGSVAVFSNPADNAARELERAHRPGLLTGGRQPRQPGHRRRRRQRPRGQPYARRPDGWQGNRIRRLLRRPGERRAHRGSARRRGAAGERAGVPATPRRRHPRVRRGGLYPLVRAFTTVVETDVVVAAVVGDHIAGRSPVYVDLVGYDEVAHHSGVERPETRKVLRTLDDEIGMIAAVAAQAGRPYRIVMLSDHGQSQGATFRDRYGKGLEDVVLDACHAPGRREGDSVTLGRQGRGAEGLGYAEASLRSEATPGVAVTPGENPVVLASGNLGLVSFPQVPGRATREWIDARYPDLIPALVTHPGIGFVLVARDDDGSVVLGPAGSADVATGEVDGVDPLTDFGPDALDRVRRTDTSDNVADLMVGGRYWPDTREVAAFEDQVGSHGGLGGPQNTPFLLYPADLPAPPNPLPGAEAVHEVLVRWRDLE